MSFRIINLTPLANGKNNKVPCLFSYYNEDNDEMTIKGFFSKNCGVKNGDQIIVISNDYKTRINYYVEVNEEDFEITLIENF